MSDMPERWCSLCGSKRIVCDPHWHCEACGSRDLSMADTIHIPNVAADERAAAFRARHAEYFDAKSPADRVAYIRKRLAERGESEEAFYERLMRLLEEP